MRNIERIGNGPGEAADFCPSSADLSTGAGCNNQGEADDNTGGFIPACQLTGGYAKQQNQKQGTHCCRRCGIRMSFPVLNNNRPAKKGYIIRTMAIQNVS